ncbi:hypothetical protein AFR_29400 [Actinoplanes friuliensis DSM 7358]|uniref:Lipoprotein n=2 Tax=Actinoplanes friuliensis TaxID=196914 RepID=U5W893_9ACTN|nr:hypothetical protein AFR_29400 [Actinoplanes friuliensis DSM 7358]
MMVKSVRLGCVAVAAVFGIGACSGGDPEPTPPPVASIVQPSAPASAPAVAERPRLRIDGTEADYQLLLKPYQKCMKAQGVTSEKGTSSWATGDDAPKEQREAQKACEQFWPLPAWERDPANPEAKDFARDVVKCLKGKGVKYVDVEPDGIGITSGGSNNDSRSISLTGEFLDDCEREVAAGK